MVLEERHEKHLIDRVNDIEELVTILDGFRDRVQYELFEHHTYGTLKYKIDKVDKITFHETQISDMDTDISDILQRLDKIESVVLAPYTVDVPANYTKSNLPIYSEWLEKNLSLAVIPSPKQKAVNGELMLSYVFDCKEHAFMFKMAFGGIGPTWQEDE